MAQEETYMIQTAFTTGEVSPEVSNRVDMDQYQSALNMAENVYIRPYGSVTKRGGTLYCGMTKYPDKRCVLRQFGLSYLLEFGEKYVRMWKNGAYLGQECATPYTEEELDKLRFAQSADVLFIASGAHPVMTLSRYSDTDWRFGEYEITDQYYDALLGAELERGVDEYYGEPGTYTWMVPADGTYTITLAGAGGGGGGYNYTGYVKNDPHYVFRATAGAYGGSGGSGEQKTVTKELKKNEQYQIVIGAGGSGGANGLHGQDTVTATAGTAGGETSAFGETAKGGGGGGAAVVVESGKNGKVNAGTAGASYGSGGAGGSGGSESSDRYRGGRVEITYAGSGQTGWVSIRREAELTLTPSGTTGTITLTASKAFFEESMTGSYMKIQHVMPSQTVTQNGGGTSDGILCGDQWKIITHGTWTGSVKIQKSVNGEEWEDYREYKSNNDFNASESGTVDEYTRLRIVSTAGNTDLTILPYTHEGIVKITGYTSQTEVTAEVIEPLGSTKAVDGYMWGAWSDYYGWPQAVGFFQDRLCLAATKTQPYYVWMSRTGDYPNFFVEKVSGTVTDDSAVALSFISRKQNTIKHIVAASDLIVMTDGDEWTVSGADTVTPTKGVPKSQTSRGCTDVVPTVVGGRIVYVQRRGKTVRDMGYSFETDNYDGMDLTLLAKHLTKDTEIIDQTYMQDPDSVLYFVLKNGRIACLSYIRDQKVYAWSHIVTKGEFESVCDVEEEDRDVVYAAVKRTIGGKTVRTIEKIMPVDDSDDPADYVMMDCAGILSGAARSEARADWLAGEKIGVLANGRFYEDIEVGSEGEFEIPAEAETMIVGIPYTMKIQLPNIEANTQQGTLQGRKKKITGVILRLMHSLGGAAGVQEEKLDAIKYDQFQQQKVTLCTEDKEMPMPNPGLELYGRLYIESEDPYPFTLAAVIRKMVIMG